MAAMERSHWGSITMPTISLSAPNGTNATIHKSIVGTNKDLQLEGSNAAHSAFQKARASLPYHLHTMYYFVKGDVKTIVVSSSVFALAIAFSDLSQQSGSSPALSAAITLARLPLVIFYLALYLLIFSIHNQFSGDAPTEDAINKPWRPIAAKRITLSQAKDLHFVLIPLALLSSIFVTGGLAPALALLAIFRLYNTSQWSEQFVLRNLDNAFGFMAFNAGAVDVLLPSYGGWSLSSKLSQWLFITGLVVLTTIHICDLRDLKGDLERGRTTIPILFGDGPTRWSVAVFMALWSVFCPAWWAAGVLGWAWSCGVGFWIAGRVLVFRGDKPADVKSWKLWSLWMVGLYLMPVF